MEQEFIPYAEALAMKELGFNEPCFACFIDKQFGINPTYQNSQEFKGWLVAPLYQQIFKWFREKHGFIGIVRRDYDRNYNGWWFEILYQKQEFDKPSVIWDEMTNVDTHQEAQMACLKKLIEIVKSS